MVKEKIFLSYHFGENESFITKVCYYIRKQGFTNIYFYKDAPIPLGVPEWRTELNLEITNSDAFFFFQGKNVGKMQEDELKKAKDIGVRIIVLIRLSGSINNENISSLVSRTIISDDAEQTDEQAIKCAKDCLQHLNHIWLPEDDIPEGYPFDYEKAIIDAYIKDSININLIGQGCPTIWLKQQLH
ncbi:MAG: hypothetical protein JXB88_19690 [Spirochaetales bacterium]|nr:hypothetical protein [Spirochaetales bacterium]